MTTAGGLKVVNADPAFEMYLRKEGIDPKSLGTLPPAEFARLTEGPNSPLGRAKRVRRAAARSWEEGRLGLVLDGTGDDFEKIKTERARLKGLGYDTFMVFVNTSLPVALERNRQRDRALPEWLVRSIWAAVQENLGKFQGLFGVRNLVVVDNTIYGPLPSKVTRVVDAFIRRPLQSRIGRGWIQRERARREGWS